MYSVANKCTAENLLGKSAINTLYIRVETEAGHNCDETVTKIYFA